MKVDSINFADESDTLCKRQRERERGEREDRNQGCLRILAEQLGKNGSNSITIELKDGKKRDMQRVRV